MRKNHKSTDSTGDRLGPLASLMCTAEPLDQLTAAERERIKLRLRDELARNRPVAKMRLLTVMAGVGLLLAGGVAVAGRWGLIRWPGAARTSLVGKEEVGEKPRRPMRDHARATVSAARVENVVPGQEIAPVPPAPSAVIAPAQAALQAVDMKTIPPVATNQRARPWRASVAAETARPRNLINETSPRGRSLSMLTPPMPSPELTPARSPAPVLAPAPLLAPSAPVPAPASSLAPSAPVAPTTNPSLAMVTPADSRFRISKTMPASVASTAPNAQDLLGQAMRSLRRQHDPATALDILARHAALFPQSPLAGERTQLEVEALLALRRYAEALLRLDGMALDQMPRGAERTLLRGELRAQARRWNEAAADFDQVLARIRGSSPWHERALWGRAMARAHAGDQLGSRADVRLYLQTYPQGRFAAEAARLSTDQP